MGKIIAITNQKGGVGKTSLCWNLSVYLSAYYGKKVLAIDLDTQGNLSHTLIKKNEGNTPFDALEFTGIQTKHLFDVNYHDKIKPMKAFYNIDLIYTEPNDLTLTKYVYQGMDDDNNIGITSSLECFINRVKTLAKNYEYVFIDCPPFIGQHIIAALLVCDYVINPVQPTGFVVDGTQGFINSLSSIGREDIFLGLILNNVDKNWTRALAMTAVLKEQLGDNIFTSIIYHRAPVDNALYLNKPLWQVPQWKKSHEEMNDFIKEVISRIDAKEGTQTELIPIEDNMEVINEL